MTFAHVAVAVPARVGSLFTYAVPDDISVEPGSIVIVPFSSRVLPGIVVRTERTPPGLPTRDLLGLVKGAPPLVPERVEVASWMAGYYRTRVFDALSLFMPPGWQRAIVEVSPPSPAPFPHYGGKGGGGFPVSLPAPLAGEGSGKGGRTGPGKGARGWAFQWPRPPVLEDTVVALEPGVAERSGAGAVRAGVRARVVALLRAEGAMEVAAVAAGADCAAATVRRMVDEGWLVAMAGPHPDPLPRGEGEPPPPRGEGELPLPLGEGRGEGFAHIPPIHLNDDQVAAFQGIAAALDSRTHRVFLLHGVTGSGKTQVYLRLIERLLSAGRRAIVLVSEIAQTPEALHRYAERFPGLVALLHSELRDEERRRLWRGIHEGRFGVVVGPRSALFAPVPNLGLVVLDEEHEPAYKQEDRAPRYHARDVAIEMGRRMGAAVVLGSATPDIASYWLAERRVYHLQSLPHRYAGPSARGWSVGMLPRVEVVDLREELKAGNAGMLSRSLRVGLERTLAAGEQAILFLNRRGSSTCVLCRDCGHLLKCRRCDVPLVYHQESEDLLCHRCNRRSPPPGKCPRCKKSRIAYFGAGTERVEEEVRRLFPSARVLRWDRDVTGRRDAHSRIHAQFRDHQADVLVGTQMVAKALDFPLVTLVGVVLADITLHLPDFRAAERTFQLLAQVAGRAGRGTAEGKVIIQTYSPGHYSLVAAGRHDYGAFYRQEMAFRRYHSYPPFRKLARLLFSGTGEARARSEALRMQAQLQAKVDELGIGDVDLLGPAPAFHSRIRGRYRWQIVLAGEGSARLLQEVDLPMGWSVDVDPMSLL